MRPAPLRTMSISAFDFAACTMVDYPGRKVMRRTSSLSRSRAGFDYRWCDAGALGHAISDRHRHRHAATVTARGPASCAPYAFYTANGSTIVKAP